jgi:hypothetical protein
LVSWRCHLEKLNFLILIKSDVSYFLYGWTFVFHLIDLCFPKGHSSMVNYIKRFPNTNLLSIQCPNYNQGQLHLTEPTPVLPKNSKVAQTQRSMSLSWERQPDAVVQGWNRNSWVVREPGHSNSQLLLKRHLGPGMPLYLQTPFLLQ